MKLNWDANCFFEAESKDCMNSAWILLRMSTAKISARRGAHYWKTCPLRPRKCYRLETLACWSCNLQCTCFSNQNVPWQKRVLRDLKQKICICDFYFCEWKSSGWLLQANQKYRGMFETQKSGSSGEIGINIRTLARPKVQACFNRRIRNQTVRLKKTKSKSVTFLGECWIER